MGGTDQQLHGDIRELQTSVKQHQEILADHTRQLRKHDDNFNDFRLMVSNKLTYLGVVASIIISIGLAVGGWAIKTSLDSVKDTITQTQRK
jgi:hypothetical protein